MKLLLVMIFVLSSSLPAWAGWIPSGALLTEIIEAMYYNDDREAVYKLLKKNLAKGMDVESPDGAYGSLLTKFTTIEWNRDDWRDNGRDFTDWDQKIFDLLLQYGADVNYTWNRDINSWTNVLLRTIDRGNLDLVKKLIKSGANPKVSFVTGNFNLRENVLIGPIRGWDGKMFSYLFPLANFPVNEIDYCSAWDGAGRNPQGPWEMEAAAIFERAFKDADFHKCKKLLGLE